MLVKTGDAEAALNRSRCTPLAGTPPHYFPPPTVFEDPPCSPLGCHCHQAQFETHSDFITSKAPCSSDNPLPIPETVVKARRARGGTASVVSEEGVPKLAWRFRDGAKSL